MEQKQQEQQKQQIKLDRAKTIILLQWLKQGFICPDDMPELREALGGGIQPQRYQMLPNVG